MGLVLIAIFALSMVTLGQTTLVNYSFENTLDADAGAIGTPNLTASSIGFTNNGNGNPGRGLQTNSDGVYIELTISTVGFSSIAFNWDGRTTNNTNPGSWELSANSGSGWSPVLYTQTLTTTYVTIPVQTLNSSFDNNSSIIIRITANNPNLRTLRLDNFQVQGCPILNQPSAITGSSIPCLGSSQTYSITNVAGVTYNWTFPTGWTQTGGGTTNTVSVTTGAGSGDITVTPSNACSSGPAQTLAVVMTSADDQTSVGTDSWIGHVYDGTNFNDYMGHYTEAETFDQSFVGNATCFDVISNSTTRSIYTETFSVRYRMNSTKNGLYVVDLGSDDGSRLSVDGTLLYNNWVDQGFSTRARVLMNLSGTSSLVYDFYENGGGNRVIFQNFTSLLSNSLTTNTAQSINIGATGTAISGDVYGALPAGISLSGTGYQWSYSTTSGGVRTNITGATGATYTPLTTIAPFNVVGTYYIYRNAILSGTNNVAPNPYVATNESNAATLTVLLPNYLSQNSGDPNVLSNWKNSSGISPVNFTSANQTFIIQSGHTMTTVAAWSVSGTNTMVEITSGGALTETTAITLSANTTLQVDNGGTLNHNVNSITIFGGTESFGSSSLVNYGFAGAQSVIAAPIATPYGNLAFSNSGVKTLAGTLYISGNWNITGASGAINTNSVTVAGDITGTGTITSGTGTINIGGDFSNSGIFTCGTGTINFNGANQQVKGATYYNLKISGGSTKTLQGNAAVGGVLNFSSGILQLGNNNLTINNIAAAAVTGTFSATAMIATDGTGYLIKNATSAQTLYPVGGGGFYSPATIAITAGGTTGTISVKAVSTNSLGINYVKKYWDVITSTGGKTITATFQYNNPSEGNAATSVWFKAGVGTWQTPPSGTPTLGANSLTITGTTAITTTSTFWTAGAPQTYYSYKSGSWNDPTTWTSDPGGSTQVGTTIPGNNDIVEILSGRTVTLPGNIATTTLDATIDAGSALDLSTFQFTAGLKSLSGQGSLKINSAVFPTPIITNTFVNAGGGTTEYNAGVNLPSQAIYNNLTINKTGSTIIQTIPTMTLNGNLLVKAGTFQINDNTAQRRTLIVNGNVTVDAGASFTVGTGVTNSVTSPLGIVGGTAPFINYYDQQSHRIVLNGDFTNNGTVRFTNLAYPVYDAFPPTTTGATSGFATVYFQGASNNTLFCNGMTDFYNLVLDKGVDQTFKLTIYSSASAYANFRLFGANIAGGDGGGMNPNLKKALWIRTGTLVLQGLVAIPTLSEGTNAEGAANPNSDYYIPANGALVVNGIDVVVQTTADDYREVNVAYGIAAPSNAAMGISAIGTGSSLGLYGKLQMNNGYLTTKESGGIITSSVAPGQFVLNNGTVDTKQFLSSTGAASFEQNGGLFLLRGRFQRTPSVFSSVNDLVNAPLNTVRANDASLNSTVGTFNINNVNNAFIMTGGSMRIFDVCGTTAPSYAFQVNSSASNINVTGGTIEFVPTTGTGGTADAPTHLLSTTTPLGNVVINRASGTSTVQLSSPLTILNNLTLTSGVLTANNQDITIGGNALIANGTTYTPGTNSTIFNGFTDQTFTVNLAGALALNKFTIDKPSGTILNFAGSQKTINVDDNFRLALGTLNDNGNTINLAKDGYNSGLHTGAGKIVMNGTVAQTIDGDGNGIFQNLTLNNNSGTAPVSLAANTTINGALTFSQDKLFNISTYNLKLNAASTIVNGGALRYIQSAGNSGDGGLTKVYSTTTAFTFPIGAPSLNHAAPSYTPASIGVGTAPTTYGSITVIPVGYAHPASTINGQSLSYFWRVKSSGFVGIPANSVTHTFVYNQLDIAGTEANYIPSVYNRTAYTWNNGVASNINTGTNTIADWSAPTNSKAFLDGDYTAGDACFGVPKIFYSRQSGSWATLSTWSLTSHTVNNPPLVAPGINDIVIIGNGNTVSFGTPANYLTTPNSDPHSCASLQIEAGATLDVRYNPNSNFGMILSHPNGNGIIRVTTNQTYPSTYVFPFGDYTDFNINLGTTELYTTNPNAGSEYYLPENVSSYGNLILSPLGGSNVMFPNRNLVIYGNLITKGQNADSWFCPSWGNTYPGGIITVPKTISIKGNLDIQGGALIWYNNGNTAQNFVIDGNLTVGSFSSLYVYSGGTNQSVSIGGSLTNNTDGVTHGTTTPDKCDFTNIPVTFFGPNNASITNSAANPTTIFSTVTVNKGSSQATTLTCDIGGTLTTPANNWFTLLNGTFRYMRTNPNTDFTLSTTNALNIPSTAGLYFDYTNAGNRNILIANNGTDANDLYLGGKLTVINGNVFVGPTNGTTNNNNDIEYSGGGASEIEVQGGTLVINGQVRQNPTTASGILKYTQSGGIVTINGNKANTTNAKLEVLNTGSQFNVSNGVLNILRGGGGNAYGDLFLRPEISTVTGGTINFTNVVPNSVQNYLMDATVPLNNLTITGSAGFNATVKLMVNPLVLNGNLTLSNAKSIFDANSVFNINVSIKGDFTNNGSYNHFNNLTTFNAGASNNLGVQSLLGTSATDFYDLAVSPITKLILSKNITVNRNIRLSDGTLESTTFKITVKGDVTNNANYTNTAVSGGMLLNGNNLQQISGTGTFGQLELNNAAGATILNDLTLQSDLILTSGIFDINTHLLTLGQISNLVPSGTPFSTTKMITSDGVWSNIGILKVFGIIGSSTTFTYPLGVPGKYTPAVLTINANSAVGSIRVNNISRYHPAVIDPTNVLNYYWEVQSIGISGFSGNFLLKYLQSDVVGGPESTYIAAQLLTPGTNWSKATTGPGTDNVNETNHTITFNYTGSSNLTGEYTAGNDAAIPNIVPQYTSNANGNWTNQAIWSPSGGTTYPCPVGGPNGFIVTINHEITADANYCFSYKTFINNKLKAVSPYYGHNFGSVYGNGTLYLENAVFPAGRFDAFLDCSGSGTLEYGGTGTYDVNADLYSATPNITFSGTGSRVLPDKDITVCKQLLINGPTLDNSNFNRKLTIQGKMLLTSGVFKSGTGLGATVSFAGAAPQSLANFTGTNSFNNFEINNGSGLTLNGSIDVSKNLFLTNGLITTSAVNNLTITNILVDCVYPDGGKAASFIDGPLIKKLNQGDPYFKFPLGKKTAGLGNKLSISATQSGTLLWTAEYFNPDIYSTYATPLTAINTKEYWTLSGVPSNSKAMVELGWDPVSDLTPLMTQNGLPDMRVAQHNGTDWTEVNSKTTTGSDVYNGSVETNNRITLSSGSGNFTVAVVNTPKPRIRMTPAGAICGTAAIPVSLTSSLPIVAPFTVNYTENGIAKSISPASFPATIPTIAGGATYRLTGFTYNFPAGTIKTGVFDVTPVISNPVPTTATVGTSISICGGSSTTLTGNNPAVGTGLWTIISGVGGSITNPTQYNSGFTGTNGSGYTLRWTISSGACTSTADLSINFPLMPVKPTAFTTSTPVVCQGLSGISYAVTNDVTATSYIWSYSGSGATINGATNSVTVDFNSTSTSGTLSAAVINGCGTSTPLTLAITINPQVWTGAVSTNWNVAGNWSCGSLPNTNSNVQIPNVANKPVLSSGATGAVKNIVIDASSSVTVTGNTLQIAGTITNNGTFIATTGTIEMRGTVAQIIVSGVFAGNTIQGLTINNLAGVSLSGPLNVTGVVYAPKGDLASGGNLTLISTAAQTALIDGTSIGKVNGNVTMQRYLPSGFGYKYVSSPFQSAKVSELADDINLAASFPTLYKYDEDNHRDSSGVSIYNTGWAQYLTTTNLLTPMQGYAANFGNLAAAKTFNISGVVNDILTTQTLYNHNRPYTKGFNLAGNPYPSPIDWNAATGWTKTNIDNALYFFDNGIADQYTGTYSSYVNGVSTGTGGSIIPSMQGFFIHVSNGTYPVSASLGMDNRVRVNNLSPTYHKSAIAQNQPLVRINAAFEKETKADPAVIYFDESATENFDTYLDALKLMNTDISVPNLYVIANQTEQLSISAMPYPIDSITKIPLGIKTEQSNWVTFTATNIENLPSDLKVYFSDGATGVVQDLRFIPTYRVNLQKGTIDKRFALLFSYKSLSSTLNDKNSFYANIANGKLNIFVNLAAAIESRITISNVLGQVMMQKNLYGNGLHEIDTQLPGGIYILTLHSQQGMSSLKIYIPK